MRMKPLKYPSIPRGFCYHRGKIRFIMREMEFKMEIEYDHIRPGADVEVEESELQGGLVVYYTIKPAIAMSGNFARKDALTNLNGKVTSVREGNGGGWYVTVVFE